MSVFICSSCETKWAAPSPTECPRCNQMVSIQDLVIADMEARKAIGLKTYGTLLYPHNGRDALIDAYQEALDGAMYLKQAIIERDVLLKELNELRGAK